MTLVMDDVHNYLKFNLEPIRIFGKLLTFQPKVSFHTTFTVELISKAGAILSNYLDINVSKPLSPLLTHFSYQQSTNCCPSEVTLKGSILDPFRKNSEQTKEPFMI